MKESEIIEKVIDIVVENTGTDNMPVLEWLFSELSTARFVDSRKEEFEDEEDDATDETRDN